MGVFLCPRKEVINMSPEISIYGKVVANVPDETGLYQMLDGSPLHVDVSRIEVRNDKQILVLEGSAIGGRRVVGLTQEGKGSTSKTKKGGDGKQPPIEVTLHDRPIRVSYSRYVRADTYSLADRQSSYYEDRRTHYNPRWIRR